MAPRFIPKALLTARRITGQTRWASVRSVTRMALAGCMALGAVAVLDIGSATAEAAPHVIASPFAGTYVWGNWPVPITISDGGQITSSYSGPPRFKGSISGRVRADGSYSFWESVTTRRLCDPEQGCHGGEWVTGHWKHEGIMGSDLAGNIIVLTDRVYTNGFVWLRQ